MITKGLRSGCAILFVFKRLLADVARVHFRVGVLDLVETDSVTRRRSIAASFFGTSKQLQEKCGNFMQVNAKTEAQPTYATQFYSRLQEASFILIFLNSTFSSGFSILWLVYM